MLQTARSLLKGLVAAKSGKKAQGKGAYLSEVQAEAARRCTVRSAADWLQPEAQLAALRCGPGPIVCQSQGTGFEPGYGAEVVFQAAGSGSQIQG